ncbi:hypothetical protein I5M27_12450 [Adhaeribacter sp. BT258]|uniref:Uncharacterized protein n=1 Tax=Adhaeribacter terrigena TaxID=2793070 RepID=A0ABS1C361_9BACT|nr:hypothetical protein [Adhaeribacter terrigena]MBK0403802.1 hypothetical protein [Adhaeribacter terrigena]
MIDKKSGNLTLGNINTISPTTTLSEIKAFKLSEVEEESDLGNGWIHYTLRNVEESGKFFNLIFFFYKENLESVSFVVKDSPFNLNSGWDSWSEKTEREKAVTYNNWLNKEIGTGRSFSWGDAWATYDPKSGGSSMGIRYK